MSVLDQLETMTDAELKRARVGVCEDINRFKEERKDDLALILAPLYGALLSHEAYREHLAKICRDDGDAADHQKLRLLRSVAAAAISNARSAGL